MFVRVNSLPPILSKITRVLALSRLPFPRQENYYFSKLTLDTDASAPRPKTDNSRGNELVLTERNRLSQVDETNSETSPRLNCHELVNSILSLNATRIKVQGSLGCASKSENAELLAGAMRGISRVSWGPVSRVIEKRCYDYRQLAFHPLRERVISRTNTAERRFGSRRSNLASRS